MALKSQETSNTAIALREMDQAKIRRLATVVLDSNDAIMVSDFEGRITAWNRGAELMYGFSEQEALQKNIWLLTPPSREEEQKDFNRRLVAGEKITSLETQRVTKDGRILDVWMTVTKLVDYAGKPVGIASTERDITGRKRKEEEFKSAKSLLDTVIDSSPFAMWISDREGMLIRTNRSLRETLNLTDEQLIGKYNVLNDANLEMQGVMPMVKAVFEMYTPTHFIIPWKASNAGDVDFKGGRDLYIDVSIFPLLDINGELTNVVCQWVNITERKQAEEALRISEARYRRTLDTMMEGCQIIGKDWRYLYVNEAAARHGRKPAKELLGRTLAEAYPGIETTAMFAVLQRCMEGREPGRLENEFSYLDGGKAWFELNVQPAPEGIFILSIDITERKLAENSLRESEEKYRLIADQANDWIYLMAPDGKMLYASPSCERVTGYSPAEFIANPRLLQEITHPDDRGELDRHLEAMHAETRPHTMEFRLIAKNGELRWINHSCAQIHTAEGTYAGRRGTNRDVTERKRAEETLRESERNFRDTIKHLDEGYYSCTAEGLLLEHNLAFNRILGFDLARDMKGKKLPDFWQNPGDRKEYLNKLMTKGSIGNYLINAKKSGGEKIAVLTSAHLIKDEKDRLVKIVGTFTDFTERKRAEEKILQLNEQLRQKASELEQVVYIASHDLRSPLVNVQGFSKELGYSIKEIENLLKPEVIPDSNISKLKEILADDIPETLHYIQSSIAKMDALLAGLLKISRIGRVELAMENLDMNSFIKEIAGTFEYQFADKGISFTFSDLPVCHGDKVQIGQVFSNIIDNAIKYADPKRPCKISISGKSEKDHAIFCVEDNGIGIAKEHARKIFEIFRRLNPADTSGEGLGLAIVQRILLKHKGKVRVESELGEGSRFFIELPV